MITYNKNDFIKMVQGMDFKCVEFSYEITAPPDYHKTTNPRLSGGPPFPAFYPEESHGKEEIKLNCTFK